MSQQGHFETHRKFGTQYSRRREKLANAPDVPPAGPGLPNEMGFIDEFHYDRDGTRMICDDFARAIQSLL